MDEITGQHTFDSATDARIVTAATYLRQAAAITEGATHSSHVSYQEAIAKSIAVAENGVARLKAILSEIEGAASNGPESAVLQDVESYLAGTDRTAKDTN